MLGAVAEVRGRRLVVELEVIAEHVDQMFLEPHHQRVNPAVEDHVGAFEAHLRRIAGREILHMHGCRDHRAGHAQLLGDVALHLRAEHQFGLQFGDLRLDIEVVVGDQRLEAELRRGLAHGPGEFARIGAEADDVEAQFFLGHPRCGHAHGVASPKMKTRLPVR